MAPIPKDRQGRGRLSRLDMLPEEAQADLIWLNQELRLTGPARRPLNELRDVFNARLAVHGIEPISNGSFSRYSVRKATQFRELDETMRMSRELADMLGTDSADKMTITLANLLQVAAVKMIEVEGSALAAKDLMELGRMVQSAVGAQKQSADYRRLLEKEIAEKVVAATADVAEIGKAAGVTPETMRKITDRLNGIF